MYVLHNAFRQMALTLSHCKFFPIFGLVWFFLGFLKNKKNPTIFFLRSATFTTKARSTTKQVTTHRGKIHLLWKVGDKYPSAVLPGQLHSTLHNVVLESWFYSPPQILAWAVPFRHHFWTTPLPKTTVIAGLCCAAFLFLLFIYVSGYYGDAAFHC